MNLVAFHNARRRSSTTKAGAKNCGHARTMGRLAPKLWIVRAVSLNSKNKTVQVATFMAYISRDAQQIFRTFALGSDEIENLEVTKEKFQKYLTPN